MPENIQSKKQFHFKADFTFYAKDIDDAWRILADGFQRTANFDEETGAWYLGRISCQPVKNS